MYIIVIMASFLTSYDYPSSLVDWDYRDGKIAMLFENEIKRQNYFYYYRQ